ncbi:MAG: hypothetical protein Q8K63_04620, partial [Acidimicrobiales bacterium]|nr:hypothetical protein [Acidimicrobiales bacterium]
AVRLLPLPRGSQAKPSLRARLDNGVELSLAGHDLGIEVGDRVRAVALPVGGVRRALWVRNETTGSLLVSHALIGAVPPLLLILLLARAW